MHVSLFSKGATTEEVRSALRRDYRSDSLKVRLLDLLFVGSLLFLARNQPLENLVAVLLAAFSALTAVRIFIDQSARNFFLHRLDWEDNNSR